MGRLPRAFRAGSGAMPWRWALPPLCPSPPLEEKMEIKKGDLGRILHPGGAEVPALPTAVGAHGHGWDLGRLSRGQPAHSRGWNWMILTSLPTQSGWDSVVLSPGFPVLVGHSLGGL